MADDSSRAGKRYTDPDIIAYVDRVHAAHDSGLDGAFSSPERDGLPAIQLGVSEGKLLEILIKLCGAKKVVEVGTLAGYSAIRIARALPADGKLWTVESDPRHAKVAEQNIAAAGFGDRVEVVVGTGVEALPKIAAHAPFDAVFIDADKESYPIYGEFAAAHVRRGGLIIGDNAYLFGNLCDDTERGRAMRAFHERAAESFDTVCVPTPDGMVVGIRN